MKKSIRLVLTALICVSLQLLFLTGCGSSDSKASGTTASKTTSSPASTTTAQQTSAPATTKADNSALIKNDTGKTIIRTISADISYPTNSYAIISKSGTVAIADPTGIPEGIKPDIITSTHNHDDHNDPNLYVNTDCKQSLYKVEKFEVKDIKVSSIASTHMGDNISKDNPDNVIYVFEVDGLRIAHMGDIGQSKLTDEQIKALGKIDIAFMQFDNAYSDYSVSNEKGIKLIEQLKPQIIIPTHTSDGMTDEIAKIAGAKEVVQDVFAVSKDDLKDGKRKVIIINNSLVK